MKDYRLVLILLILGILTYYVYNYYYTNEHFTTSNNYFTRLADVSFNDIQCDTFNNTAVTENGNNASLSTGSINKFKINNVFEYHFKFNLPLPFGGDYIPNDEENVYKVYLSETPDTSLYYSGNLERASDGWFKLIVSSEKEYHFAVIKLKEVIVFKTNIN